MDAKKESPVGETVTEKQRKDNHYFQFQQTQIAFFSEPKTMMQAARQINIDRGNVCWYIRDLRKANAIWITNVGRCPITKHNHVKFWSTNPKYAENLPKQLTLF